MSRGLFDPLDEALEAFAAGQPLVVVDDELRENEGDIIFAAAHATPEKINFCIKEGRGLVCIALATSIVERLQFTKALSNQQDPLATAFLNSVDAIQSYGVSTGISAADRSTTARLIADPASKPTDFSIPGHLFPLQAAEGGLRVRKGHTEAAVALCSLTRLPEAAIICEILDADGTMLRREGLRKFADTHQLKMISIDQLAATSADFYNGCELVSMAHLPTLYGKFDIRIFRMIATGIEHTLISIRDNPNVTPLVRIHSECHTGDVFGSLRCDCGEQLQNALQQMAEVGHGYLIYIKGHEGRGIGLGNKIAAYQWQEKGLNTYQANEVLGLPSDARDYSAAISILAHLKIDQFSLLTNNPKKVLALQQAGFSFQQLPIPATVNPFNRQYLSDKKQIGLHQFIEK
jgi:3,4-dihydroxy 2-butanone 4-phosphate synthase / GTP cyclohydrolase II